MEKYLIEIALPAAGIKYDMLVPELMQVGTLTSLAASVLSKLSKGMYTASPYSVLCERGSGMQFDRTLRLRDTPIRNGTRLILY